MLGFSDARLATLTARTETSVRAERQRLGVRAVFKRIDTCAAEFEAQTPYMYSTYEVEAMAAPSNARPAPPTASKVVILGGGPNRIGQGIEFDYCCCHACFALTKAGYETIMVNCNPETVSTDYDTSDRLYFEPLTLEHVLEILRVEQENGTLHGVIVQFGGQTPLKLANALHDAGIPILGTTPDAIDLAEDRERFQAAAAPPRPRASRSTASPAPPPRPWPVAKRDRLPAGHPPVLRPRRPRHGDRPRRRPARPLHPRRRAGLRRHARSSSTATSPTPSRSTSTPSATARDVHVAGVMEHIEEAGVHSGDSACSLPPYSLDAETIAELEAPDRGHGPRPRRRRPDERPVRHPGRRHLRARGQPPRLAAPSPSSPRPPTAPSPPSPPASWPASRSPTSRSAPPTPQASAPTTRCPTPTR